MKNYSGEKSFMLGVGVMSRKLIFIEQLLCTKNYAICFAYFLIFGI